MAKNKEEKIKEALDDIMIIVNETNYASGSGGIYDGNAKEEIKDILRELVK